MTARLAAYETLLRCEKEKQYSNIAINHAIQKYQFDKQERDFVNSFLLFFLREEKKKLKLMMF